MILQSTRVCKQPWKKGAHHDYHCLAYERNKHLTQNLLLFAGRRKNMDKPHTKSSFAFVLCESQSLHCINCSYYDVVFQFKERHATFLERKITLSITQQLEKRFAVKSLGVNICGGKTCTNPLTPYILENCLRGELLHTTAL